MKRVKVVNRIIVLTMAFCIIATLFLFQGVTIYAENDIPAYTECAAVAINGNVPGFTVKEITTVSFEHYGELDSLGRCTTALACIGKDLMPTQERQSIGDVRPTGWVQNKYPGIIDSEPPYLYNRCHLIGFQLTGENANENNLITGTRYLNVEGMLPYENEVADYIRRTGNHVMYRVSPVFTGDNMLCDGVQIEAYSVEDKGKGISFNVFCYNVQPGISIDYRDGSNWLADSGNAGYHGTENNVGSDRTLRYVREDDKDTVFVINKNSKKFHDPDCEGVLNMKEKNRELSQKTREELIDDGYEPCRICCSP